MRKAFLNPQIVARAAGTDKANRRMRRAGRIAWDEADYAAAVAEYYRVYESLSGADAPIPHCVSSNLV